MRFIRAALLSAAVVAVGVLLVSGGSGGDPRTPAALPGLSPPFLGTAVTGDGGLTAAVDAYGDVVDVRAGPAGVALIDNPADRQAAGTVPAKTGIVPRMTIGGSPPLPMWRGTKMVQRYRGDSNVIETTAYVREARLITLTAAAGDALAMEMIPGSSRQGRARPAVSVNVEDGLHCVHAERAGVIDLLCTTGSGPPSVGADGSRELFRECDRVLRSSSEDSRRWLARSIPLGESGGRSRGVRSTSLDVAGGTGGGVHSTPLVEAGRRRGGVRDGAGGAAHLATDAPVWARSMYRRSLLTVHALTSHATGAVAAGARDGWAYVWPRDATTAALALEASGHRAEARHVARFLTGLDLGAAARFTESGAPVPGRAAQGDASGWVTAAADATGLPAPAALPWRNHADYQESTTGTYLANALAAAHVHGPKSADIERFSAHQPRGATEVARIAREFGTEDGLVRSAGDPGSGLDSAAGWAVRPFDLRTLYPDAEKTLLRLIHQGTSFGITPGEGWTGGDDPWSAPTAWSAWALAGLSAEAERTDRRGPRTNLKAVREVEVPSDRSPHKSRLLRHEALALLTDLRRAATPAGDLPERVGVRTGIPTSTTPLLWSSAFTVLALRELWP